MHGTNQMLHAYKRAGIKHIVLTSSVSEVSFNFRDEPVFINEHWSNLASPQRQPYPYCKALSERMCRDFCREISIVLSVILSAIILGPPVTTGCNGTLEEGFMGIVNGSVPTAVNIPSPNCDVRDIAAMPASLLWMPPYRAGNSAGRILGPSTKPTLLYLTHCRRNL